MNINNLCYMIFLIRDGVQEETIYMQMMYYIAVIVYRHKINSIQ